MSILPNEITSETRLNAKQAAELLGYRSTSSIYKELKENKAFAVVDQDRVKTISAAELKVAFPQRPIAAIYSSDKLAQDPDKDAENSSEQGLPSEEKEAVQKKRFSKKAVFFAAAAMGLTALWAMFAPPSCDKDKPDDQPAEQPKASSPVKELPPVKTYFMDASIMDPILAEADKVANIDWAALQAQRDAALAKAMADVEVQRGDYNFLFFRDSQTFSFNQVAIQYLDETPFVFPVSTLTNTGQVEEMELVMQLAIHQAKEKRRNSNGPDPLEDSYAFLELEQDSYSFVFGKESGDQGYNFMTMEAPDGTVYDLMSDGAFKFLAGSGSHQTIMDWSIRFLLDNPERFNVISQGENIQPTPSP